MLDRSKLDPKHKRARTKSGKYPLLETALHIWYLTQEEQESTLLEFVMVEKARKLVELDPTLLGEAGAADAAKDEFLFSAGWFERSRIGLGSS